MNQCENFLLKKTKNKVPLCLTCVCVCVCQREGALGDDDSADMDGENGRGFEEYEWAGQKRIRATALLEGGFRGKHTQTHTGDVWPVLFMHCFHSATSQCELFIFHTSSEVCVLDFPLSV